MRNFLDRRGFIFLLIGLFFIKQPLQKNNRLFQSLKGPDLEPLQVSYRADSLRRLSFGFNSFLSSLLWVRLQQEAKYTPLKTQKISWEASEVDAITTLDPNFRPAYHFGSLFVSFFRRDKEGGKRILEKWVRHDPIYWKPHHMLGMHYFLELNDYQKAAPHIIRASQLPGAPAFIASLGVGLLGQSGASLFALQSAAELFDSAVQFETRKRLAKRIRSLRWNMQKDRWEKALAKFKQIKPGLKPSSLSDLLPYVGTKNLRELGTAVITFPPSDILRALLSEEFAFRLDTAKNSIIPMNPQEIKEFGNIGVNLTEDPK